MMGVAAKTEERGSVLLDVVVVVVAALVFVSSKIICHAKHATQQQ